MTLLDIFHPPVRWIQPPTAQRDEVAGSLLHPTPPAWYLSSIPEGTTPAYVGGTGAALPSSTVCLVSRTISSWDKAKQLHWHHADLHQRRTPGLLAASTIPRDSGLESYTAQPHITQHSHGHTRTEHIFSYWGFNAFLKLLFWRQD